MNKLKNPNNLIKNFDSLEWVSSNHIAVLKKIIFAGGEFVTNITQVAYSELDQGMQVPFHIHESMEEVFFIIEGECEFNINDCIFTAERLSVVRIPANTHHSLIAITNCKFFYFGVSL